MQDTGFTILFQYLFILYQTVFYGLFFLIYYDWCPNIIRKRGVSEYPMDADVFILTLVYSNLGLIFVPSDNVFRIFIVNIAVSKEF